MPHITFDRAADCYDSTRSFPEGVAERIRDAIVSVTGAGAEARFLELGVGTGRIALPFIRGGYDYTGVDLSRQMMERLQRKLAAAAGETRPRCRLLQGDITRLPLAGGICDVVIAVHVLHLVDGWQEAVAEARRVLRRPGGCLLIAPGEQGAAAEDPSPRRLVNRQWDAILHELGVDREDLRPGLGHGEHARTGEILMAHLQTLGAATERLTLAEYAEQPLSPRTMAQRHIDRIYSADWLLPAAVHAEAAGRLAAWLERSCPEPDRPLGGTGRFTAIAARW